MLPSRISSGRVRRLRSSEVGGREGLIDNQDRWRGPPLSVQGHPDRLGPVERGLALVVAADAGVLRRAHHL